MKFALISFLYGIKGQDLEHKDLDNEVIYNEGYMVRPLFFFRILNNLIFMAIFYFSCIILRNLLNHIT